MGSGSAAPGERYYCGHLRYYRATARYYRGCQWYNRFPGSSTTVTNHSSQTREARKRRKLQGKRRGQEGDVYVMIPPKPFQRGPPLNSTAFLRLKSTEKKRRETPSSIVFEGHQIVLCLDMIYLKCSMHTISPQKHCHQSPKQLRDKYALTISPFLVD